MADAACDPPGEADETLWCRSSFARAPGEGGAQQGKRRTCLTSSPCCDAFGVAGVAWDRPCVGSMPLQTATAVTSLSRMSILFLCWK